MSLSRSSGSGSASTTAGRTPGSPTRGCPDWSLSPAEMLAHGTARAGLLKIPVHPGMVFDFLPVAWRTIQHYGVEVGGLRYDGPALTRYRNRTSPFTGVHAGKWPVRYDSDDVSRVTSRTRTAMPGHQLAWEHADPVGVPFSADALAYARRLVLAGGRHVDERRALAELLDRWDAGLVRHPAERRMAVRASQQRAARLAAPARSRWRRLRPCLRSPPWPAPGRRRPAPVRREVMTTAPAEAGPGMRTSTLTRSRCCRDRRGGSRSRNGTGTRRLKAGWFAMAEAPPRPGRRCWPLRRSRRSRRRAAPL